MLNISITRLLLALALACGAAQARAQTYHVAIDTKALAGQQGYLDFLLLGLSGAAPAQATLSNFSGDFNGASLTLGDASSAANGAVNIGNSGSWNEFALWANFGGTLSFDVRFQLAGGGAGSTLSVTLLDADLNYLGLAGDYATFALLPGDTPSIGASGETAVNAISAVPEPASMLMLSAGLLLLGGRSRRSAPFVAKS